MEKALFLTPRTVFVDHDRYEIMGGSGKKAWFPVALALSVELKKNLMILASGETQKQKQLIAGFFMGWA